MNRSSAALLLKKARASNSKIKDKKEGQRDIIHSARLGAFSASAAKYTSSIDIDRRILEAVIDVNIAHVLMLSEQKIISKSSSKQVIIALKKIPRDFQLNDFLEDVHMNVEDYVISKAGKEAGGMLNIAKSRNDQVATALRITLRDHLLGLARELITLEQVLLAKAFQNAAAVMPGYTHLQRAQPITLGHHLLAHEETFERDLERIIQCYLRMNKCPMGAGALASSGFLLNRKLVATLLGFDGLIENSLDAVSARDFVIESIYDCAQIMSDVSKLAEEIILWTSKEFSFAVISDKFAATSSMMPQKKNAIVPEVARARTSQVAADLVAALGIVKSLPLSYNLDLQELTRNLWTAIDKTLDTLRLFSEMITELKFNEEIMDQAVQGDETLFATEVADYLVTNYGMPFREAHSRVSALVRNAESSGNLRKAFTGSAEEDISSILGVAISKKELSGLMDPHLVLSRRRTIGSPNPRLVKQSCKYHTVVISKYKRKFDRLEQKVILGKNRLMSRVDQEIGAYLTMNKNEQVETGTTTKKWISETQNRAEVK